MTKRFHFRKEQEITQRTIELEPTDQPGLYFDTDSQSLINFMHGQGYELTGVDFGC
jgi:hypothetical protein